jgi:hypothetical protein
MRGVRRQMYWQVHNIQARARSKSEPDKLAPFRFHNTNYSYPLPKSGEGSGQSGCPTRRGFAIKLVLLIARGEFEHQ